MYFLQSAFWNEAHAGALFFVLLAVLLEVIAIICLYEAKVLNAGLTPITMRVRAAIKGWPWIAGLIMFGLGFLAGHFFAGD